MEGCGKMEKEMLTWEECIKLFHEILNAGDSVSILFWHKLTERSNNGSRILLKCIEKNGAMECYSAVYRNGSFYYMYENCSGDEVPEKKILGWDYYPYSDDGDRDDLW